MAKKQYGIMPPFPKMVAMLRSSDKRYFVYGIGWLTKSITVFRNGAYEIVPILKMKVSPQARKQNPSLPEYWYARAVSYDIGGVEKTVLTSLPAERYPAKAVAELYHSRWEIEVGFRNIKSSLQSNAMVLRSRKVELLHQEVWGLLLAYNLIRREAALTAKQYKRAPSEMSFKFAFGVIATELIVLGNTVSPGTIPKRLMYLRGSLEAMFITKRPRPSRPRAVKISKTRYPVNRYASPLK